MLPSVGIQFTAAPAEFNPRDYPGWTYFVTRNIDQLFQEYQDKGVKITRELESHGHGMRGSFKSKIVTASRFDSAQYQTDFDQH